MLNDKELKTAEMYKSLKKIEKEPENVYKISLRGTGVTTISGFPEIIRKCKNLQYLDIEQTPVKIIPEWIGELVNLQILKMAESNIREIPETISKLINLHTLTVDHSLHFGKGIESIYTLNNLKHLGFRAYKSLDKNIQHLNKIEYLEIDNLSDEYNVENIYEINSLKELYLQGYKLTKIPEGIAKLTNLEKITISASPIKELPDDFSLLSIKSFSYIMLQLVTMVVDKEFMPNWDQIIFILSKIKTLDNISLKNNLKITFPQTIELLNHVKKLEYYK
jgi:Leucine-rich repeat (LRR) protein